MGKNVICCFIIYYPDQKISFVTLFFFEVMTIIQIFLKGLDKLNCVLLNGWVLNFLIL